MLRRCNRLLLCHGLLRRCSTPWTYGGFTMPSASLTSTSPLVQSVRFQSSKKNVDQSPQGVVILTHRNIAEELEVSKVPTLLLFHITNNPQVVEYAKRVIHQVTEVNRRFAQSRVVFEEDYGKDKGLAIKLCLIDCQQETTLVERFHISPHHFPMLMFVRKKEYLDRLTGVVEESQVKEAIDSFIEHCKDELVKDKAKPDKSKEAKMKRADNDDENAMTLLQVAHQKLRVKEIAKAKELYTKAQNMAEVVTNERKKELGFGIKKETPEMWETLRRDGNYNALAQSRCGLAMCEMANRNYSEGLRMVQQIRVDFPYAVKDMKDVAEAVCRIELVAAAKFDLDKDNYVTLMRFEELETDPVKFYQTHVKLAVAHVFDKKHRAGIVECVKLIRAERKLLPALKAGGEIDPDVQLGASNMNTPARRVLLLIFEVLGNQNETTVEGRKMVEPYL